MNLEILGDLFIIFASPRAVPLTDAEAEMIVYGRQP